MANVAWRFTKSSAKFLFRVGKKSLVAAIFLLFQLGNFYWQKIRYEVSDEWRIRLDQIMTFLDQWTFWLAIGIIIFAILDTFWEVDRELRDPKVTKKLKAFYSDLENLLRRNIVSETNIAALESDFESIRKEMNSWIKNNMDHASFVRLGQRPIGVWDRVTVENRDVFNARHSELINSILDGQRRLLVLIESPVWN